MATSPFFSIIIPVYNVEQYLSDCLDSILSQSYKDFEVLLIDDGSKDDSAKILADYQSKYSNVIVFSQANKGQGEARNVGIDHAKGKYIWFIDADDFIRPDSLSFLYSELNALDSDKVGLLFTYHELEAQDEEGKRIENTDCGFDESIATGTYSNDFVLSLLFEKKLIPMCCNKIFSKRLFDERKFRFLPGVYFEDVCFSAQMIDACDSLKIIRKDLYVYNKRQGSTMISACTVKHIFSMFAVLHDIRVHLKLSKKYDTYKISFADFYWHNLTFFYLRFVQDSDIDKKLLFLEELSKSTSTLDLAYYLPGGENGDDFPFAILLKFMSENPNMNEEIEEKLMESFNFPQEFMDNYM